MLAEALQYADDAAARFLDEYKALLRIPSVSTLKAHAPDVARAAQVIADDMRRIGMTTVEVHQADGYLPVVYGAWDGAGADAPTVLVYTHFDVQPAAMEDGWHTDPFEPVEQDGKIIARGTLDSKSHVMIHLKAIESLLATGGAPVNLKVLLEGEEESGSAHIFQFVRQNAEKLRADVIVVSDGSLPSVDQPVLVYGLRGLMTMELTVFGPGRDLHSGHYGGNVHNPIQALTEILAPLHDEHGRVTIPGFYDEVMPLSDAERAALRDVLSFAEAEWHAVADAPQIYGDPNYTLNERMGARPTLEINGIRGGYAGEGFKTVLPSHALAKISCRLVPYQDPDTLFERIKRHIESITPPTVRAELRRIGHDAPAFLTDYTGKAMQAAISAYTRGWGKRPILSREGGSIPVTVMFQEALDGEIVLLPYGYKGGGAHGPNEYSVTEMFHKGIKTTLYFYEALHSVAD